MTIFRKLDIHPFTYMIILLSLFTGLFKELSYIMILFIIHEIGHIIPAIYFRWNIEKIIILPFGGLIIFNEKLNKSMTEELIITICGPIFQIIGYAILKNTFNDLLYYYHITILIFNLFPIHPLDGSKIINITLNYFFSYKLSHKLMIIISVFLISITLLFSSHFNFNFFFFLTLILLFFKTIKELKNHEMHVNKFIFERYNYIFNFKKIKKIKSTNLYKMKRDHKHLFYNGKYYITENEILKKKFDFKKKI